MRRASAWLAVLLAAAAASSCGWWRDRSAAPQRSSAPAPPRGAVTGLRAVVGPGTFLVGASGAAWEVAPGDRATAAGWGRGDRLEVIAGRGTPPFRDVLVNHTRRQGVAAREGRRLD